MTIRVRRDVACADGCAAIAELVYTLVTSGGRTLVGVGIGSGSPSTSPLVSAAALATQLRTAPSSWVAWSLGDRTWSLLRSGGINPDYRSWKKEYTRGSLTTAGTGTAPPRNASTSQYVSGNSFRTSMAGSSTGAATVNEAMKVHIVYDDAGPSYALIPRRTPFPGGNVGCCGIIACDELVDPIWPGNTDPVVNTNAGLDSNTANTELVNTTYNNAWLKYGLGGSSFPGAALFNPGSIAGSANSDQGGSDILVDAWWVAGTNILGTSRLFKLVQPGRTPVVGVDNGATLTHAAFWTFVVENDGIALTS
jgi:hypothetical protein